jgi:hypothetical protein
MTGKHLIILILGLCAVCLFPVRAQYSMGVSGLMSVPSADMQADGMFMCGLNYLPLDMLPHGAGWKDWGSINYYLNITFLPFLEVAYRCTILDVHTENSDNTWQQDRSVSLRFRVLKEKHWWPSLLVGSNDAFTTGQLNPLQTVGGNRFFSSVYAVATKHIRLAGHDVGFTVGGLVPMRRNAAQDGVFGGVSYAPACFKTLTLMAEYDTNGINAGAAIRLCGHLSAHVFAYDFRAVSCGLRYEFPLLKHKP